jgi:hypothetical protein
MNAKLHNPQRILLIFICKLQKNMINFTNYNENLNIGGVQTSFLGLLRRIPSSTKVTLYLLEKQTIKG